MEAEIAIHIYRFLKETDPSNPKQKKGNDIEMDTCVFSKDLILRLVLAHDTHPLGCISLVSVPTLVEEALGL